MKFSIVMPMYKQPEEVISRAVYSIINQTYKDWELIICDNGSYYDGVTDFIDNLRKKDKRVIYFKNEKNVGWPKGISLCLERATGEFMGFIADDDYLEQLWLEDVYSEIEKNNPDVIWLGQKYDILEDGIFKTVESKIPTYKVLEGKENICKNLISFFQDVYFNSMQHYISMDLLKRYRINFYDKYIGDCGAMAKVLSVTEKMVILNKAPYHLTYNTSLTRGCYEIGGYNMFASQWISMIELLETQKYYNKNVLSYIAKCFAINYLGTIQLLCNGDPCRNDLYENISLSFKERFCELEKTLSNYAISEMIDFYGREEYFNIILNNLIILLQEAQNNGEIIKEVIKDSSYLGDFVLGLLDCVDGTVDITKSLDIGRIEQIVASINHLDNISMYGYEIILKLKLKVDIKTGVIFEILKLKQKYMLREQALAIKYNNTELIQKNSFCIKLISIVCYCYNVENGMEGFINYLLNKGIDIDQLELIFINNASTDCTDHYLLELEKRYSNSIIIINLEKHLRKSEAINIGISYATNTECIGVVNTDDLEDLNKYI